MKYISFGLFLMIAISCGQNAAHKEAAPNDSEIRKTWWKECVIYQIYPRSFKDSNGDGIGDLQGIIEKLDYLKELGVDVIWLSPVYKSPNDDNGYDISDYQDIMDEFGTMADFDELLAEMKKRNLKLIMDLVVNHSSDEHKWFQEARKSKDNPYRDYYIWKAPKDGKEPNNWKSFFSGPAWQYDSLTGEYFLHLFSKKQPDLNWENPKLREEVYKMMRFWLEKGVAGFRMDVIPFISKDPEFKDFEYDKLTGGLSEAYANGPRLHEFLQEMNREVMSKYDVFSVGEAPGVTPEIVNLYVGEERNELDMIFHFQHLKIDRDKNNIWKKIDYPLAQFKDIFEKWDKALGHSGWGTIYLGNHDTPRILSHFGNEEKYRVESAKMLATLLFTHRGTVDVYQGDEIGMTNVSYESIEDYDDIQTHNAYREKVIEGGEDEASFIQSLHQFSRDNARTPIQWSNEPQAGFTTGEPWLKVNPNYDEINAQAEVADPNSIFNYYKRMIGFRKEHPMLVYGAFEIIDKPNNDIYAYVRSDQNEKMLVVLNFTEQEQVFDIPENFALEQLLLSNYESLGDDEKPLKLRPYEARIYHIK